MICNDFWVGSRLRKLRVEQDSKLLAGVARPTRRASMKKLVFSNCRTRVSSTLLHDRSEFRRRHSRVASAERLIENCPGEYTPPHVDVQFAE
jgi:hypothetical protein